RSRCFSTTERNEMPREPYKPLDPFRSAETPADAVLVDPLTRLQRRSLLLYYEHREVPFRLGPLVWRTLPNWCLTALLMAALVAIASIALPAMWDVRYYLATGIAGAVLGMIARDIGYARRV